VIGAGGLGAFAVQLLRVLSPAVVVAVDSNPDRLAYVTELGAHHVVAGVDRDTGATLRRITNGEGATAVLDFVGIDHTIAVGVGATQPFGTYAVIGSGSGTFKRAWYGGLPRDGEVLNFQGSSVADVHEVVRLAEQGLIRSDTDLFSLDRVGDAYDALHAATLRGRAVVTPES
jgi:propanol-preferring alcohol dehydrogenase